MPDGRRPGRDRGPVTRRSRRLVLDLIRDKKLARSPAHDPGSPLRGVRDDARSAEHPPRDSVELGQKRRVAMLRRGHQREVEGSV
jgi:hypothetical protein